MFPIPLRLSLLLSIFAGLVVVTPLLMWATRLSRAEAGWRWRGWPTLALGFGWGGLLALGLAAWLRLLMQTGDYLPIPAVIAPADWLLLVVAAPVAEELFFRGAVLGSLQRSWSPFWAIFLSAIIYTGVHSSEPWIAVTLLASTGYALAFRHSGSVLTSMLAHALAVAALLAARSDPAFILSLPSQIPPIVGGGCILLLLIAGRAQKVVGSERK